MPKADAEPQGKHNTIVRQTHRTTQSMLNSRCCTGVLLQEMEEEAAEVNADAQEEEPQSWGEWLNECGSVLLKSATSGIVTKVKDAFLSHGYLSKVNSMYGRQVHIFVIH